MNFLRFIQVAQDLEQAGLLWNPEIGDEVASRVESELISIIVDPQGMNPSELRNSYIWLPSVEQLVMQLESRQAILFHAGLDLSEGDMIYRTVIRAKDASIEANADSLRSAVGIGLRDLLLQDYSEVH